MGPASLLPRQLRPCAAEPLLFPPPGSYWQEEPGPEGQEERNRILTWGLHYSFCVLWKAHVVGEVRRREARREEKKQASRGCYLPLRQGSGGWRWCQGFPEIYLLEMGSHDWGRAGCRQPVVRDFRQVRCCCLEAECLLRKPPIWGLKVFTCLHAPCPRFQGHRSYLKMARCKCPPVYKTDGP